MNLKHFPLVTGALLIVCGLSTSHADIVNLKAVDTASPRGLSGIDDSADNRLRSGQNGESYEVDGHIKFNLSSIPNNAAITGMTLTVYAEGASSTPIGNPLIQIRRWSNDSWVRGGSGFIGRNEYLTPIDAGPFPSTRHTPYSFTLDVGAVNWAADLADNYLTLVLDEVAQTENDMMFFFGSSPVTPSGDSLTPGNVYDYAPTLTVQFIPEPASALLATSAVIGLATFRRRCF